MKILWFTNSAYSANDVIKQNPATGTWLIALAQAFALLKDIELHIVFYSQKDIIPFKHNGIHYHPIFREGTENKLGRIIYRIKQLYSKSTELIEIEKCKKAIEEIKPDIIHVHGTEENYGLACIGTKYPYVISIQGLISSSKPLYDLLANSGSQRFALPIIQASANPFAMISSAIQASVILPTVATGILTCFFIYSDNCVCEPCLDPGAGIELPFLTVLPPETCKKSTLAFSSCLAT